MTDLVDEIDMNGQEILAKLLLLFDKARSARERKLIERAQDAQAKWHDKYVKKLRALG